MIKETRVKDDRDTKKYIRSKILWPFIVFIIINIVIITFIILEYISGFIFKTPYLEIATINMPTIIVQIIAAGVLMLFIHCMFKRKLKDEILFASDAYGTYYLCWYLIAKFIGYRKISLNSVPYKIHLLVLRYNLFEPIFDQKEAVNLEKEVDYNVVFIDGTKREINIIVSDTYEIEKQYIPNKYLEFQTYKITRTKETGIRYYAPSFIDEVGKVLNANKDSNIKMNLFMTTSIPNTRYLFKEYILLKGRHNINIEIFQMSKGPVRYFYDEGYKYRKGQH